MPATYNDVMTKIGDVSANLQSCFTALRDVSVTVPADSSLNDLAALITSIPAGSAHPDYDLPWLMADGSHGFITHIRQTASANNTVAVTLEMVPAPDNNSFLYGTKNSVGGQVGLNQMTAGLRARNKLCTVSGTTISVNENNYAGMNNQWSDSSYPYYKKLTNIYGSINDATELRAVLYNGINTVTAGSGMTQPSGSVWPNYMLGILCAGNMANEGKETAEFLLTSPALCGTKLYELKVYSGPWSNKTLNATFTPVLHWDSSWGKYRPCFKGTDGTLTSFAIAKNEIAPDSSVDGAYYVDTAQGLENISLTDITSSKWIDTIDYVTDGTVTYIANMRFGERTSTEWNDLVICGSPAVMKISCYMKRPAGSTTTWKHTYRFYSFWSSATGQQKYHDFYSVTSSTGVGLRRILNVMWTPRRSGETFNIYTWSPGSTVGAKTDGGSVPAQTTAVQPICLRAQIYNGNYYGVNSLMAVDSASGKVLHYVVLCKNSSDEVVYYDCVTKTLYS